MTIIDSEKIKEKIKYSNASHSWRPEHLAFVVMAMLTISTTEGEIDDGAWKNIDMKNYHLPIDIQTQNVQCCNYSVVEQQGTSCCWITMGTSTAKQANKKKVAK